MLIIKLVFNYLDYKLKFRSKIIQNFFFKLHFENKNSQNKILLFHKIDFHKRIRFYGILFIKILFLLKVKNKLIKMLVQNSYSKFTLKKVTKFTNKIRFHKINKILYKIFFSQTFSFQIKCFFFNSNAS